MSVLGERPAILKWGPVKTSPGAPFNIQPNGDSALWMKVANVSSSIEVRFQDESLPFNNDNGIISVPLPKKYYIKAGEYKIYILDTATGLTSNIVVFTVR